MKAVLSVSVIRKRRVQYGKLRNDSRESGHLRVGPCDALKKDHSEDTRAFADTRYCPDLPGWGSHGCKPRMSMSGFLEDLSGSWVLPVLRESSTGQPEKGEVRCQRLDRTPVCGSEDPFARVLKNLLGSKWGFDKTSWG